MVRRSLRLLALGGALVVGVSACQKESNQLGPPSSCAADEPCHGTVKGGGSGTGGGGAGGGEGGGSVAVDASGTVSVLVSSTFEQTSTFAGHATILAPGVGGTDVTADYAGAATGFTIHDVASGAQWFLVEDATAGGAGIFSTFSLQHVPSTSLVLPAMDRAVLTQIASALPLATAVEPGRAHVVVFVDRGDQPLAGAALAGGAFGGTLAYDEGAGFYSNSATATGTAGVVLILNATAPGQGTATIHVTDPDGKPYALDVPIAPDAVTLVGMEI